MARKSSSIFPILLLGVGGYFAYENWPAISAWLASMTGSAAAPTPAVVPATAGTVVSTTPAAVPAAAATTPAEPLQPPVIPASAGTIVTVPQPITKPVAWGLPVRTTAVLPARIASSVIENRVQTRSGGFMVNNR